MSMEIEGLRELQARFKALKKDQIAPAGKAWTAAAERIVVQRLGGMSFPYSGAKRKKPQPVLRPSIAQKKRSRTKFGILGSYHGYFVDPDDGSVAAHSLAPRARVRALSPTGRTIFAKMARKQHPGYQGRNFRHVARQAEQKAPILDQIIKAWNGAA